MIADKFPQRTGAPIRVARPTTADEWRAYEGTFIRARNPEGKAEGFIGGMLKKVISETHAAVHFSNHKHPEDVPLDRLMPWVKGQAIQEGHRAAREAKPIQDPDVETYIFSNDTEGFLAGVKSIPDGLAYSMMASCQHGLKDACHFPRSWVLANLQRIRKSIPSLSGLVLMTEEEAVAKDTELRAKYLGDGGLNELKGIVTRELDRVAKLARKAEEQTAKEARWAEERNAQAAKIEAEKRTAELLRVMDAKALLAKHGVSEPEVIQTNQRFMSVVPEGQMSPVAVPVVSGPEEVAPLAPQRTEPETAPVKPPVASTPIPAPVPQVSPLEKAKQERRQALRDVATARGMVREAEGRLEQAETEIRILEEG